MDAFTESLFMFTMSTPLSVYSSSSSWIMNRRRMYCPKCSKEGITFWDWGRSFNAFRYTCPHCLEPLKANGATTKWFIGVMLWVMVVVGLCIFIQEHLKIVE